MLRARLALVFVLWWIGIQGHAAAPTGSAAAIALSPDEQTLKNAHVPATGPGLLAFFHQRSRPEVQPAKLTELVRQLGDKSVEVQERAAGELVAWGTPALPRLRQAANSLDDLDTASRARGCLQAIEGSAASAVPTAAARLLVQRKPTGAAEALLAYLPQANDDGVAQEVEKALAAVAYRDGKLEPVLLEALRDEVPVRRAIAAVVLCQVGKPAHRPAVRKMLKDPRPSVRLRAALGLANLHEAEAVPVLIELLAELPQPQRTQAEAFFWSLAGEWSMNTPAGNDAASRRLRRDLWSAWWRSQDDERVLDEFRKRTLSDPDREQVLALIRRLGDAKLAAREKAAAELLELGGKAVPLLRQAVHDADPRISQYATKLLQVLEKDMPAPLPAAAIRLAMLRRPPAAAEVLLAYLPFAESPALSSQVQAGLAHLAFADGKPADFLVRALEDPAGPRRIAAAELLCQAGATDHLPAVRKLLQDADALVRLRIGLTLAERKEKPAIGVLIALIQDLPVEQGWQVEEYLTYIAGDQAPDVVLESDDSSRGKCHDAWAAWWKANGATLDLAKVGSLDRELTHTLVVEQVDQIRQTGRVLDLDAQGRIVWQIEGLLFPNDAQLLPDDRVLIVEQNGQRVTERDFHGIIHWQKQVPNSQPIACQRLRNGNTFITCRNRLVETERTGKEVFTYERPGHDIVVAERFRDGQVGFVTNSGTYIRLDATGQEVRSFQAGNQQYNYGFYGLLPHDHVLVPQWSNTLKLVEFNGESKAIRELPLQAVPSAVVRMPNGHLLITSMQNNRILQIDRNGKTVWEFHDPNIRPLRALRH
jgi:HEAT repeat protein